MNIDEFRKDAEVNLRKYSRQKYFGKFLVIISLGLFSNKRKIHKSYLQYEQSKAQYESYRDLTLRAINIDDALSTLVVDGVRISKHTFYDLPVLNKEDYGFDWDLLRNHILYRDSYTCQDFDGYCNGPLQIHHIAPLSKGGSNSPDNLITLCYFHHSMKHPHMRRS
jgi:hypothetical protein